jgi:hypothetical protein
MSAWTTMGGQIWRAGGTGEFVLCEPPLMTKLTVNIRGTDRQWWYTTRRPPWTEWARGARCFV